MRCVPLDDDLVPLLVARTLDERDDRLRTMTHDLDRFSNPQRVTQWLRRGRDALCLVDATGSLLGILWVAEKRLPERDDYFDPQVLRQSAPHLTFAIRLYDRMREADLATVFAEYSLGRLLAGQGGTSSVWYQTRADNTAARSLGRRLGFTEISSEQGGTVIGAGQVKRSWYSAEDALRPA